MSIRLGSIRPPSDPDLTATVLRVAWISVLVGLLFEALSLGAAIAFATMPAARPIVAEIAQKVSWSLIVCVGLALGTAASKLRVPATGVAGALAAPIAFIVARVIHKAVSEALGLTLHAGGPPVLLIGVLKGAEYACLGLLLGYLGRGASAGATAHVAAGAFVGLLFGGAIVALFAASGSAPVPLAATISRAINELLFPIGCSLVLYAGEALARRSPAVPASY